MGSKKKRVRGVPSVKDKRVTSGEFLQALDVDAALEKLERKLERKARGG